MASRHKMYRRPGRATRRDEPGPDQQAETSRSVRDTGIIMVTVMLLLLVFNSSGLQRWARDLPGNSLSDVLVHYTDSWHGLMQQIGTAAPKETVQNALAEFRQYSWSEIAGFDSTANAETIGNREGDGIAADE